MELDKIIKMMNPDANIKAFDLNTEEGLEGFNNTLDELENTNLSFLKAFGIDGDELIKNLRNIGNNIYKAKQEQKKQNEKNEHKIEKNVVDHTIENNQIVRPSEKLSVPQKLQLHKIVQEYVDTMIKPHNNGYLSNNQINDAYAGLYEFAAWIMNR